MKKIICYLLLAALLFIPFKPVGAWSSFRNETGAGNANITAAQTPVTPENTGAKWQLKFETDAVTAYNSDPVITDDKIYSACKNTLYELNKNGVVLRTFTLAAPINSVCRMSLHENRLFIPLSGGTLQCVDIQTMSSLWTSESFGLQSLTSTFYKKGFLCAGTTSASGTDGLYYCLSETDGSTQWVYRGEQSCGYYWSGAVSGKDGTDYILFGGDNGVLISHSLSTDAVYDTYDLSSCTASHGKIRAGVTYDIQTDAFYTTTTDGYLYQIKMNEDGEFRSVSALPLFSDNSLMTDVNCTSTPTIFNGRIYVCSYDGTQGQISVVNAASMNIVYTATTPECHDIKSSPLVCTGYATDENNNRVYVYFTQNSLPGGIYYIEDDETAVSAQIKTLFLPVEGKQFCLSSVAADTDGTLYYSNDSGTLFAISEGYAAAPQITPQPNSPTPILPTPVSPTPEPPTSILPAPTSADSSVSAPAVVKPEKPGKIVFTKKKRKNNRYRVTFTWKKGKNSDFTQIKIQGKTSSKKKYERTLDTFRKKITATLKKGTYTIRFYSCRTSSGKPSTAAGIRKSGAVTLRLRLR